MNYSGTVSRLFGYAFNTFLVLLCVFLVFFVASLITSGVAKPASNPAIAVDGHEQVVRSNGPNLVSSGFENASKQLGKSLSSVGRQASATANSMSDTASLVGSTIVKQLARVSVAIIKAIFKAIVFVFRTILYVFKTVILFVFNSVKWVLGTIIGIPVRAIGAINNTPLVSGFVNPSEQIAEVPIIDPESPELKEALAALAPNSQSGQGSTLAASTDVRWPLEGTITTRFGVPHYPYQPIHSGIDISDFTPSGTTPIRPFRAGKVINAISSNYGLGNHVIVDHGNGVTSVYAHLASIAVAIGQDVDIQTDLGMEGSTGTSTGTHLHFEIRINGQATDPMPFLNS